MPGAPGACNNIFTINRLRYFAPPVKKLDSLESPQGPNGANTPNKTRGVSIKTLKSVACVAVWIVEKHDSQSGSEPAGARLQANATLW